MRPRRRNVVMWTDIPAVAAPAGIQFIDVTSLPPDVGPGWLELESPDCQVMWVIVETRDKVQRVTRYATGPASRSGCWLRDGASVRAVVHNVAGSHVNAKGLYDGGAVDARLQTRFFPGLLEEPSQPLIAWVLDGAASSRSDGPALAATSNTALGYAPGYTKFATGVSSASQTIRLGFLPSHSALIYPGAGALRMHHNAVLHPWFAVHAYNSAAGTTPLVVTFTKEPYSRTSMDN